MPVIETVSIINKSGKLISTSKHLVNIFKDAKDAYHEKKNELRAEALQREQDRLAKKLQDVRLEELQSVHSRSSRRSRHSSRSGRHRSSHRAGESSKRPALTERNLAQIEEGSVAGSHHSSRHGGVRVPSRTSSQAQPPVVYQPPHFENTDISKPELVRRRTENPNEESGHLSRSEMTPFPPPQRSMSSPNIEEEIDMNLAYGDIPPPLPTPEQKEQELRTLMSRIDRLMVEAQCIQHSAATIISTLQQNPEAMAAVALTLAEISNLIVKMSPGILTALKASAPAVFALLASPQFLIAGGVAVGVTIVMFGGYKIVKKIQQDMAEKKEAERMEEAMAFEGDLSAIETWRRGIADAESQSVGTSVDGEFITPEAARVRKERIRERAREERRSLYEESIVESTTKTAKATQVPERSSSKTVVVSGSKAGSKAESKGGKQRKEIKEKKAKKPSALTVLFKKGGPLKRPVEAHKPVLAAI